MLKMLSEGYTVITDRYYFSSYAYQSPHIDQNWVIQANSLAAGLLRPDINIYIDISPEISIERLNKGRTSIELYETLDNLRAVRDKYLEIIGLLKSEEKVFMANGNQSPEETAKEIWGNISNMLQENSEK